MPSVGIEQFRPLSGHRRLDEICHPALKIPGIESLKFEASPGNAWRGAKPKNIKTAAHRHS